MKVHARVGIAKGWCRLVLMPGAARARRVTHPLAGDGVRPANDVGISGGVHWFSRVMMKKARCNGMSRMPRVAGDPTGTGWGTGRLDRGLAACLSVPEGNFDLSVHLGLHAVVCAWPHSVPHCQLVPPVLLSGSSSNQQQATHLQACQTTLERWSTSLLHRCGLLASCSVSPTLAELT